MLLFAKGKSTMRKVEFDYPVRTMTYRTVGERHLQLYVFEPEQLKPDRPAILFFNGGSFQQYGPTPAQFQHQADYFASQGIIAICVDYRNGDDEGFSPIQAICDAKSAIRKVRASAGELGIDPNKIAVCGASAGGYIAVSSIMLQHVEDEPDPTRHTPDALIVFAAGMDGIDIMGRLYPELLDTAEQLSPLHNVKACLPPTLWMCGTADPIFEQNQRFVDRMNSCGNNILFKIYNGMEHGFFNYGRHENKCFQETSAEIRRFLASLGYTT